MGNITKDERQARQVINKLVNGLNPPKLRDRITRERVMWTKENDGQIPYFVERAKLVAKEVQVSEEFRSRSSNRKEGDGWGRGETTNPSVRVRGGPGGHHGRGGYHFRGRAGRYDRRNNANPVSYTHLTLPTKA